mgnify:CR=1 FL=1
MVSVSQNNHQHRPLMVQAPVRALDPDGLAVVTAGTIGFAIGTVVCWWSFPQLSALGKGWYLGTSITGTVIGLLGLAFGLFRKVRRRQDGSAGRTDAASPIEPGTTAADGSDAQPTPEDEPQLPPRRSAGPAEPDDSAAPGAAARSVEESLVDADGVPDRE